MGVGTIILIALIAVVVIGLLIVIIKTVATPKRLDAIPRLIKQGKTQNAIKLAKQILQKDPKNYLAHYYLGKSYIKEGKNDLAILEYRTVNDSAIFGEGIDEVSFRREYSDLLLKYNQFEDALKELLLLSKMDPNNAENFYQIGHIYENQNRYDIALGFLKKCVMYNPKHAKAHAELGLLFYRTKNFNEAKKEIDMALKLSPETYSSYYYLGKILKDAKDLQGAIKAFEKAQRDPEVKLKAIIEHGSCYMVVGRFDNAALDFQRAIDLDKGMTNPESLYAHYFLATCYEKSRKIDKAIEEWELIYKRNKAFRDVSAKLSEYKDLQSNDSLKDYLTSGNDDFLNICKTVAAGVLNMQILTCDLKKWGCQITGVNKGDENWMNVRKQVIFIRFYREPEPVEDGHVRESLDIMKSSNAVKGFLFSSSSFTNSAKHYAENRPIELIEKQKLEAVLTKAGA